MSYNFLDDGHVSSPLGFRATGISGGLKDVRARDLALVYSVRPCTAAGMFTTSAIVGAPIFFDQAILARNRDKIRAVLINAGPGQRRHRPAGSGRCGRVREAGRRRAGGAAR